MYNVLLEEVECQHSHITHSFSADEVVNEYDRKHPNSLVFNFFGRFLWNDDFPFLQCSIILFSAVVWRAHKSDNLSRSEIHEVAPHSQATYSMFSALWLSVCILTPTVFILQGLLRIHLLEAQNLVAKDNIMMMKGKSDPYVKINIGAVAFKSHVIKENLNPTWNEMYEVWSIHSHT